MKSMIDRVRELRDVGMSVQEAKRTIRRQDLNEEIARAATIDDIKSILFALVA